MIEKDLRIEPTFAIPLTDTQNIYVIVQDAIERLGRNGTFYMEQVLTKLELIMGDYVPTREKKE